MGVSGTLGLLWLFHLPLTAVSAVQVTVGTPTVQVIRGGAVLLPCSFRTTAALNRLNIIWTVAPLQEPRRPLQPTQDASIFINQTRTSDTGTYQCTVINPPDGATPNIGLVGLSVLVPPSSPECSSEGQSQEGGRIHLRCSVTEGIPAPTFTWEKIPDGDQVLITSQEDYRGSVTLTNLTSETSGLYRCTVRNQLGSESCVVELDIHVGGLGAMGIFAAITITLSMGLLLLVLLALVLCLHQQSHGKRETGEIYRVDNLSSVRVTRSLCGDNTVSRRMAPSMWIPAPPTPVLSSVSQRVSSGPSSTDSEDEEVGSSLYSGSPGYLV